VISHRVITRSGNSNGETTFITKGDNNDLADPNPIMEVQIQGKLWYSFPYLGWVNNAVNGSARTWITPVVAGALFIYAGYTVASTIAERRRRKRRERRRSERVTSADLVDK
jgi:signal peptidase